MWYLFFAIVASSVLGSLHCVGMCGPLAIFASGAGGSTPRGTVAVSTTMYHLGRLATYLLAGSLAGYLGSLVDVGGELIGWQVTAARLAGAMMVLVGIAKLWAYFRIAAPAKTVRPSRIAGVLVRLRPFLARRSPIGRAFGIGFLTTFLPCGWLYVFMLVAAGTGNVLAGTLVMFAFWIGTVPALTSLIAGTGMLANHTSNLVPVGTAILLVTTGVFTASGRGFSGLDSLDSLQPANDQPVSLVRQVENAEDVILPCCRAAMEANQ